ncbi:MAG: hypothetical protein ABIQ93_12855 [Saprospiraceae bacterium]
MINEENRAALEAYLRQELSAAETDLFLHFVQNDPALRAELALHKEIEEATGASPLNEMRRTAALVLQGNRPKPAKRPALLYWGLALLFVLGALAFWMIWKSTGQGSQEQIFADFFHPPAILEPSALRGEEPQSGPAGNIPADSLYRVANYAAALKILEADERQPGVQRSSAFYYRLAIVYLANRQAEPAIRSLDRIAVGYQYEKQWYRALALLLSGKVSQTKKALRVIIDSGGPFKQDAGTLLQRLD